MTSANGDQRSNEGRRFGAYRLHEMIGQGGMGLVYRATQPRAGRDVAIKVMGESLSRDPHFLAYFQREGLLAADLLHPHILPIYDVGLVGGQPYLAMAYLTGGNLAQRIAAIAGGMLLEEALSVIVQVSAALDYAHQRGVLHRDIKPGNVLFDSAGNAYLSDFGLAAVAQMLPAGASILDSSPVGTPAYLAPEVKAGQTASPAADIFALGVMFFEMLTGRLPGPKGDAIGDWRPELPLGLRVVVDQAMHSEADSRPASARALARSLALAAGPALATPLIDALLTRSEKSTNGFAALNGNGSHSDSLFKEMVHPTPHTPVPGTGIARTQANPPINGTPPPAPNAAPTHVNRRLRLTPRHKPPFWASILVAVALLLPLIIFFTLIVLALPTT